MIRRVVLACAIAIALAASPAAAQTTVLKWIVTPGDQLYKPFLPHLQRYESAGIYERWWQEIAACEGLPLPPQHRFVRFVAVNGVHFYDALRPYYRRDKRTGILYVQWAVASTYLAEESIFVALPYLFDDNTIKHEQLHLLMKWAGLPSGHPPDRFERCGVTTEKN